MILGTAGHIDHGKTSLVKALTGVDTDRLPEEKRRGITIDLGFAPLVLEGVGTIGIVDVPGHEGFIRTMLAGASGIDIALLVIAADEGVMPQTREHLEILSLLAVRKIIVVLSKSDLVNAEWLALVHDDAEVLLADSSFPGSSVIPVSAESGAGMENLRNAIAAAAAAARPRGPDDDVFRMPIDRVFTIRGTGTVVTGTIWSGSVSRESTLVLRPGDRPVRVRGVQTHGKTVGVADVGERAALALAGCDVADVSRGSVLVSDPAWVGTTELDAEIEVVGSAPRITARTRLRFHLGTSEIGCRIAGIEAIEPVPTRQRRRARVVLDEPVLARGGDRFVLRYPSPPATIGGGRVLDPYPGRKRRASPAGAGSDTDISGVALGVDSLLQGMLADAGAAGVRLSSLPVRLGVPAPAVAGRISAVGGISVDGRVFAAPVIDDVARVLSAAIAAFAVNYPLEPGVSIQTLRASSRANTAVIDAALRRLTAEGRIELDGALARPAGWKPQLDAGARLLSNSIMRGICIQPNEPPSVRELCEQFGDKAVSLLRKLERDGEVVRVSDDRYYASTAMAGILDVLRTRLESGRVYSPAELREVLGVSRKYLIPLLEFCDRTGVTERRSSGRALVAKRP